MTEDEIVKYIKNIKWEDIKNKPHSNNRLYVDSDTEILDNKTENSSWVYLTIFDTPYKEIKDRYFGSETKKEVNCFMESEYCGTPITFEKEFNNCLSSKNYRVICLKIQNDSSTLVTEQNVLDKINASKNEMFFNSSNISGGTLKKLGKQIELFNKVINKIQDKKNGYRRGRMSADELFKMERAQPRNIDIDENHVNDIAKDITESKGKILSKINATITLENFKGKDKHLRGGNTHTIEATQKPGVKKYCEDGLELVYVSEEDWIQLSEKTIRDILRWDNRRELLISIKHTPTDEIIESCYDLCAEYNLSHIDVRVKERATLLGATGSDWQNIRTQILKKLRGEKSDAQCPEGMERIIYTKKIRENHENDNSNDTLDCKILTTVGAGGSVFTGYEFILNWLCDTKNKKKRLHIDFMHGEQSYSIYADAWDKDNHGKNIKNIIKILFEKFGKKDHVTFDTMKLYKPKTKKIILGG
jgi:hypothetical protein